MVHHGAVLCPPPPPLAISSASNTDLPKVTPRFDLDKITHIISETWEIPERQLIESHPRKDEIHTVTVSLLETVLANTSSADIMFHVQPIWHTRSRLLHLQE
jgi:hypothetical protein